MKVNPVQIITKSPVLQTFFISLAVEKKIFFPGFSYHGGVRWNDAELSLLGEVVRLLRPTPGADAFIHVPLLLWSPQRICAHLPMGKETIDIFESYRNTITFVFSGFVSPFHGWFRHRLRSSVGDFVLGVSAHETESEVVFSAVQKSQSRNLGFFFLTGALCFSTASGRPAHAPRSCWRRW